MVSDSAYMRFSNRLYGNQHGVLSNCVGGFNHSFSKLVSSIPQSDLRDKVWEKGYKKIGEISDNKVRETKEQLDRGLNSPGAYHVTGNNERKDNPSSDEVVRSVISSVETDLGGLMPAVDDILTYEIVETIEKALGSHARVHMGMAYRYYHTENYELTREWHIDPYTPDQLRVFVLLDDTVDTGSPTLFLTKEQTAEVLKSYSYEEIHNNPDLIEDNFEPKKLHGKPGDIVVSDPINLLHRGENPDPGKTRDMCHFTFAPAPRKVTASPSEVMNRTVTRREDSLYNLTRYFLEGF